MNQQIFSEIIAQIEEINKKINILRPFNENLNLTLQEKLRIEWTYNSNAIEGNTLTFGETHFFLREGLTSEGRPLKDFLEAKNHAEAIYVLEDFIRDKEPLTEFFIKSLHGVLLSGMGPTRAQGADGKIIEKKLHIGEYKKQPNHVLTASGEMQKLIKWYNSEEIQKVSAVERAALLHFKFVTIHPFDDGNGRISRLLMNLVLMQSGLPPCIIKNKNRGKYIKTLEKIRQGENDEKIFILFIATELKETMLFMEKILKKEDIITDPFHVLNIHERREIIESTIGKNPVSISQIREKIPSIKPSTLREDIKKLLKDGKIYKKGRLKSVVYFKK